MTKMTFTLEAEFIRLDDLLKINGCVETGGQAKILIQGGGVTVDGEDEEKAVTEIEGFFRNNL